MSFVQLERPRPDIAVVTLDRPERRNAMSFDVMIPLRDALRALAVDNDTRAVVLTGAGEAFCSGADLEDPGVLPHVAGLTVPSIARRAMRLLDEVIRALRDLPQPVIGAIQGPAIGGGFCLALATDIRVAAPSARFRAAGLNNGLTAAELGLSYLLPRAIGSSRAFEILLTGRDVEAQEALHMGLVSRVVAPEALLDACLDLGGRMAAMSRVGIELTKELVWSSLDAASLEAHMRAEGTAQLYVRLTTENFEEAVRARRERRAPRFTDQRRYDPAGDDGIG